MPRVTSLRLRLFTVILIPLILMAALLGYWRFTVAQSTAEELFDRSLLSAALAISRDVAVSGGDALSNSTRGLIGNSAAGEVFYHATGPNGIYVTGYAYPPVIQFDQLDQYAPQYAIADYRDDPVRVLQITERVTIDNLTGDATVTVWQRLSDRNAFAQQLAIRAAALILALLVTLALVVWFGVQLGLRPLLNLKEAIDSRSPDDLSTIKRPVPIEAQAIVQTLNRLFGQMETSIQAQKNFISDAAHQLRNPAAAVQSMAEAVQNAPTQQDQNDRIAQLVLAARSSARVAEQLLSLDRLQQPLLDQPHTPFDLNALVQDICTEMGRFVLGKGIDFELIAPDGALSVLGDPVFVAEAIKNLIDNAMKHGGADLSAISVALTQSDDRAQVTIRDDGKGLTPADRDLAFRRFSQVEPSDGSGLGLAIAASIAERHHGSLTIDPVGLGASMTLSLPVAHAAKT